MMHLLGRIYRRRFRGRIERRNLVWKALCAGYFQRLVPEDSTVLEIGVGCCEFINNIRCRRKIAFDANVDIRGYAGPGVEVIIGHSTSLTTVPDQSVDVVFLSNFFEHLSKGEILETIGEIRRVLRPGGRLLVLQPNYRYCFRDFWMFFDHVTPLDDRSVCEALEVSGFSVISCHPRFLPYTMASSYPLFPFLIRIYLKFPPLWWLFGQQAFIVAAKETAPESCADRS